MPQADVANETDEAIDLLVESLSLACSEVAGLKAEVERGAALMLELLDVLDEVLEPAA
jgi:hypothetical protein